MNNVFISYSHDSDDHKEWVRNLADRLNKEIDINIILDQYDLKLGNDLPRFMQDGITESRKVLIICTDNYNKKANSNAPGGVGYEKRIMDAEIYQNNDQNKFIPIVKQGRELPIFLGSKYYSDFTDDSKYDVRVAELIDNITEETRHNKEIHYGMPESDINLLPLQYMDELNEKLMKFSPKKIHENVDIDIANGYFEEHLKQYDQYTSYSYLPNENRYVGMLEKSNLLHKSMQSLDKAIERNSTDISLYLHRASLNIEKFNRHHSESNESIANNIILDCMKCIAIDENCIDAYISLFKIYTKINEKDLANICVSKCISIDDTNSTIYALHGGFLEGTGDMHAALSSYNKAINLDPDNIGYYHLRQSVLEHLKRFNDVLSDYHKIINLMIQEGVADSTIASEISRRARMYYKLGDYKRFYSDAKWASELQPNNDTYRKWQFDGAKKLGNYTEVIQYCNLKLKEHPQSAEFYLERAKANRSLHKIDDANKDFDLATKFSDKEDYDFQVQLFDYNRDCSANAY